MHICIIRSSAGPLAPEYIFDQPVNSGDVPRQFLGNGVARCEVRDTCIADPHTAITALPDEGLEWQVESEEWGSNHQWSTRFWIAKDQHMRILHLQSDSFRFPAMVDMRKYAKVMAAHGFLQTLQCLLHGKWTRPGGDALYRGWRSEHC